MIDLRSDTVTRPTPAMRKAMAEAEVGDDVYREDPTVRRLEEQGAELLGKEAALFFPTGTMGNEAALIVHARPGDEVILDERSHIFNYEMGAIGALGGLVPRPVAGDRGFPTADQVESAVRSPVYYAGRTGMVALENTHNMAGGTIYPEDRYRAVLDLARKRRLPVHLDGARLFNAAIASNRSAKSISGEADSVMITLSKGLAAPSGSLLAGSGAFIEEALRVRKRLGGGMRQVGILAAAGLIALDSMIPRLAEDHAHARLLAGKISEIPGFEIDPKGVETNIVIFRTAGRGAAEIVSGLRTEGVLCLAIAPDTIRMVTHLDVSRDDILRAAAVAGRLVS